MKIYKGHKLVGIRIEIRENNPPETRYCADLDFPTCGIEFCDASIKALMSRVEKEVRRELGDRVVK